MFARHGFKTEFFGDTPLDEVSILQKVLRPVKKFVVDFGLMPKSMAGKKFLKKIVFGGVGGDAGRNNRGNFSIYRAYQDFFYSTR